MRIKKSLGILLFFPTMLSSVQASNFPKLDEAIPESFVSTLAPVFDFDGDSCYPSAGISRSGERNSGLKASGSITGECRKSNFLNYSNTLHRYACVNKNSSKYCGHFYALYFLKDDVISGVDISGIPHTEHRHDWEYAAIWTKNGMITHGGVSSHGKLQNRSFSSLPLENGHMKVVYHKDDIRTHAMRFAGSRERAENSYRRFVTPTLISWYSLNHRMRTLLNSFDYGSASIPLKDGKFLYNLNKFKPSNYPTFQDKDLVNPAIPLDASFSWINIGSPQKTGTAPYHNIEKEIKLKTSDTNFVVTGFGARVTDDNLRGLKLYVAPIVSGCRIDNTQVVERITGSCCEKEYQVTNSKVLVGAGMRVNSDDVAKLVVWSQKLDSRSCQLTGPIHQHVVGSKGVEAEWKVNNNNTRTMITGLAGRVKDDNITTLWLYKGQIAR
jgi:hypothetical protein